MELLFISAVAGWEVLGGRGKMPFGDLGVEGVSEVLKKSFPLGQNVGEDPGRATLNSSWLLYTVQRHFFIRLQLFSQERQWSGGT